MTVWHWIVLISCALWGASACAQEASRAPHVEILLENQTLHGEIVAHTKSYFWLQLDDGRLSQYRHADVKSFRPMAQPMTPQNVTQLRDQLRREFQGKMEVAATGQTIVVASTANVRKYSEVVDDVTRSFQLYFGPRGFEVSQPRFPLVTLVFPDVKSFGEYAEKERTSLMPGLRGYYLTTSNRVALFEKGDIRGPAQSPTRRTADASPGTAFWSNGRGGCPFPFYPWEAERVREGLVEPVDAIEADLMGTLVHEATHQLAFNLGLHSRMGQNPRWVVEGLATVFESPQVRRPEGMRNLSQRLNVERLKWFQQFEKTRRKPRSLEEFVRDDRLFMSAPLDAYSQAWALTFFLSETRSSRFASYLKKMRERSVWDEYNPSTRVADFKAAIASDLVMLDAEFLRWMAALKVE